MHTLRATSPLQAPLQATLPAPQPRQLDHTAVLARVVEQVGTSALTAITYEQIETAMTQLGLDPFEESDTYQGVIDALEQRGIAVVDTTGAQEDAIDADALAEEVADDVVAQLKQLVQDPNEYRHPLLTAERERRLLELVHDGKRAERELTQDCSPVQRHAAERRINAAEQAMEELVRCNLRLVAQIAIPRARYMQHLTLDDLIQEGEIGLCRAIEKYDLDMNMRLSTYATWWIRQAIGRAVADQDRTVRLPVHVVETLQRLVKEVRRLEGVLGPPPTAREVVLLGHLPVILPEDVRLQLRLAPMILRGSGNTSQDIEDRIALDVGAQCVVRYLSKAHPQNDLRQKLEQAKVSLQQHLHRQATAEELALICDDERLLPQDVRLRLHLRPAALEAGRPTYDAQLDALVQKATRKILDLQSYLSAALVSLDRPVGNTADMYLADVLPADSPSVEDLVIAQELERLVHQGLTTLDERTLLVLKLRFGIKFDRDERNEVMAMAQSRRLSIPDEGERWTLEEVGHLFDVTRECIRQIEVQAFKKFQSPKSKMYAAIIMAEI